MIERYGFYEGKGTSYRVAPRMIIDILRTEKSPEAGGHQRLPIEPANDRELAQVLAVCDPSELIDEFSRRSRMRGGGDLEAREPEKAYRDTNITDQSQLATSRNLVSPECRSVMKVCASRRFAEADHAEPDPHRRFGRGSWGTGEDGRPAGAALE